MFFLIHLIFLSSFSILTRTLCFPILSFLHVIFFYFYLIKHGYAQIEVRLTCFKKEMIIVQHNDLWNICPFQRSWRIAPLLCIICSSHPIPGYFFICFKVVKYPCSNFCAYMGNLLFIFRQLHVTVQDTIFHV